MSIKWKHGNGLKLNDTHHPANIYLFKANDGTSRKRGEVYSKLTIKTAERRQWRRSGVFIVKIEHISHLFLVFVLVL